MDLSNFTDRARGFLQATQGLAARLDHQAITPAHLLKVLIEDPEGLAGRLIGLAGGNAKAVETAADQTLRKIAKVAGSSAQAFPRPRYDKTVRQSTGLGKGRGRQLCNRRAFVGGLGPASKAPMRSRLSPPDRLTPKR